MAARTHEQFLIDLRDRQPEIYDLYKILGVYKNNHTKIEVQCRKCGVITSKSPSKLLIGRGCNNCRRLTKSEIDDRLLYSHKGYIFNIDYESTVYQVVDYICDRGHAHSTQLRKLMEGVGCPYCAKEDGVKSERFYAHINSTPNLSVVSEYVNCKLPIVLSCKDHGEFTTTPDSVISKGTGCPVCKKANLKYYNNTLAERHKSTYLETESGVYLMSVEGVGLKVGISNNPKARKTAISCQSKCQVDILNYYPMNLYQAIQLEGLVAEKFQRKTVDNTFAGYTEMFEMDLYLEIKTFIEKYLVGDL